MPGNRDGDGGNTVAEGGRAMSHSYDRFGQETTECTLCNQETPMIGTKLCDRCWELKSRIEADPELARKILASINNNQENQ